MKECFTNKIHLNNANKQRLVVVEKIVQEYADQGYRLTLRQLYYQLVARQVIDNKVSEYTRLSRILVQGRMAGVVDWDAIEDRVRVPHLLYSCEDIKDALKDTMEGYRLDRQKYQPNYIEILCEKDALSGVLKRITEKYHVSLLINRGYSSCTAVYYSFKRFQYFIEQGKKVKILYVGDHDPSGLDMIRDINERLEEFGYDGAEVIPVALTKGQIKKYSLPPDPAKITDPRAKWYIKNHGKHSWEVDALPPPVLHGIVEKQLVKLIDMEAFEKALDEEEEHKDKLKKLLDTDSIKGKINTLLEGMKKKKWAPKLKKSLKTELNSIHEILDY